MAKLFLFMMVTLDGYFEGEDHDISWHNFDQEMGEFVVEQTSQVGTILFGRKTYEMMASYWPTDQAKDEPEAVRMNETPKIVFSKTLKSADWQNTTLKHEVNAEEIKKLKETSEKDIAVFGSSDLCVSLLKENLLDELRLMINPVILGKGKLLFQGIDHKLDLKLTKTRNFKNGNRLLYYDVPKY